MSKIRVYELARDLGLESKDLVDFLEELGADVKNHMSTIEDDIAELVREHFSKAGSAGQAAGGKAPQDAGEAGRKAPAAAAAQPPPRRAGEQKPQRHDDQDPARGREPRHGKGRGPGGRGEAEAGRETRGTLVIPDTITVKDYAEKMSVRAYALIMTQMRVYYSSAIH